MLKLIQKWKGHKGKVWSVAWTPNGTGLASCGEDKSVNVWQSQNQLLDLNKKEDNAINSEDKDKPWPLVKKFGDNHERTVRDVAWSPCGKFVAVASFDATISVWEKTKGNDFDCVTTVEGHENEVKSVAWSPSGQYFASCGRDKNVMIWSITTDGEYDVECESVLSVHSQDVKRVSWHPTEDILVSASYDNTVKLYRNDPDDGDWTCTATLEGHESTVWSVDFDSTGNRLVTVSDDRAVRVWTRLGGQGDKGNTWSCVSKIDGYHQRPIYDVSWNKTNGLIATACGDDTIRIFKEVPAVSDVDKNIFELIFSFKAHAADVNRVQWNPKVEGVLVSCGDDGYIKIWKWVDV